EMATPCPRDDSYLRTTTTIDTKRNALAADVRRLTDQEASGPAKTATFDWIETATDRQLDGWLTFSNQAFIDSVKAKGPAVPVDSREQPQFGILPLLAQEDKKEKDLSYFNAPPLILGLIGTSASTTKIPAIVGGVIGLLRV
ncbi:hypothetical protein PROFUN_16941, partial [Planoprotostelium fungivorum]